MFLTALDKQTIITTLKTKLPKLQALYLFGSQKDGSSTKKSDVDVAYLSQDILTPVVRWELSQALASQLSRDVDLIDLSSTNTIFRYQILSTGERIYGSGYAVESFETLAYSFYLRFREERRPIINEILKNRSIFGNTHA